MTDRKTVGNRLLHEKSPYLLQHAHNPVDWYPWGDEAFLRARKENKPIFLSIGYSTCHWCHVMLHESFEDTEVASLLNQVFINIKVDREERPDIDQVYMAVSQLMTGKGGWPLTIVMTPEKKPFFAGTYIPRESRNGMLGLRDLIPQLQDLWKAQGEKLRIFAGEVIQALHPMKGESPPIDPSLSLLEKAYGVLEREYDPHYGGFGVAPKFPSPHQLLFLLRIWYRERNPHALSMVEKTLQEMRKGGIFDQVGFGFHRYSIDRQWIVPHFEKMLYDQALLAITYLETYQVTKKPQYARTAREIFTYVLRDLTSEEGSFFSAEDADSEGGEGRFYIWTCEELEQIFGPGDLTLLSRAFSLKRGGNLSSIGHGLIERGNLLHGQEPWEEIARERGISEEEMQKILEKFRMQLLQARNRRIRPDRDSKIQADWNGFMIAAFAFGGRVLGEKRYTHAAEQAAHRILTTMRRPDGRLNHAYSVEESYIDGFLDDYAAMAWGEVELFETTFKASHLKAAIDLMHQLRKWYWDEDEGGFFFTPSDGEPLIIRKKEALDGAVPSGNSLALYNLLRLAALTGNSQYTDQAIRLWRVFSGEVKTAPPWYTFLLLAADFALGPTQEIVIAGNPTAEDTQEMLKTLNSSFYPRLTALLLSEEQNAELREICPFLDDFTLRNHKATAYVCSGHQCHPPTTETEKLQEYLSLPSK
jgi:hypothetical protein